MSHIVLSLKHPSLHLALVLGKGSKVGLLVSPFWRCWSCSTTPTHTWSGTTLCVPGSFTSMLVLLLIQQLAHDAQHLIGTARSCVLGSFRRVVARNRIIWKVCMMLSNLGSAAARSTTSAASPATTRERVVRVNDRVVSHRFTLSPLRVSMTRWWTRERLWGSKQPLVISNIFGGSARGIAKGPLTPFRILIWRSSCRGRAMRDIHPNTSRGFHLCRLAHIKEFQTTTVLTYVSNLAIPNPASSSARYATPTAPSHRS